MWIISLLVCGLLIGADQFAKFQAVTHLKPIGSVTVLEGFLDLTFVENRGAAFGMLHGQRWFFVVLTIVVSIVIVVAYFKMPQTKEYHFVRTALVLLLAGAVGNLIDRVMNGYVVDFLEVTFISFPVFNLADIYVVIGAFALAFLILFVIKEEPKN